MAREDFRLVADVPVDDILLDTHNARIRAGTDQNDCILRILRKKDQLLALCENIAQYGLTTMPILATPNTDGTYVVKDGNRRTTALKLLNHPTTCPDPDLVPKLTQIAATHKNFPSKVDLTVTDNEDAMIREVLSRHQGEMGGIGQMGWSAYLRTLYLLNHGHTPEYKRPGQFALWAEGQGIYVDDEFPISSLQRFFTLDNLRLLGFEVNGNDELSLNLPLATVKQMTIKVVNDFGQGKNVNEVFTPEQAKTYIDEVRASAGVHSPTSRTNPVTTPPASPQPSPPGTAEMSTSEPASAPSASPTPNSGTPRPRPASTPATSAADRKKIFGSRSPGIAIPGDEYPKAQTIVAELRKLDLTKFSLAATFLLRGLIEVSDARYRTTYSLPDTQALAKNIRKSVEHMHANGKLSEAERDIVLRVCSNDGAMIEIETLQKMLHKSTHNSSREFVNTLWDNLKCFVVACWA